MAMTLATAHGTGSWQRHEVNGHWQQHNAKAQCKGTKQMGAGKCALANGKCDMGTWHMAEGHGRGKGKGTWQRHTANGAQFEWALANGHWYMDTGTSSLENGHWRG